LLYSSRTVNADPLFKSRSPLDVSIGVTHEADRSNGLAARPEALAD
jgi:hypothetical protein